MKTVNQRNSIGQIQNSSYIKPHYSLSVWIQIQKENQKQQEKNGPFCIGELQCSQ